MKEGEENLPVFSDHEPEGPEKEYPTLKVITSEGIEKTLDTKLAM